MEKLITPIDIARPGERKKMACCRKFNVGNTRAGLTDTDFQTLPLRGAPGWDQVYSGGSTRSGPTPLTPWRYREVDVGRTPVIVFGSARFGVCCQLHLYVRVLGSMRAKYDGRDYLQILLNDQSVFFKASDREDGVSYWVSQGLGDPMLPGYPDDQMPEWYVYPHDEVVRIDMPERACGNVIEIRGSTGPVNATEHPLFSGWDVYFQSLT